MKRQLSLLSLIFLTIFVYAETKYHFTSYSVQDGLSQLHVNTIYQDKTGYIWLGTRNGLNRFNGNAFTVFMNSGSDPQSISNSNITCITEDTLQNIWVGTENGLNKLDTKRNGFKRYFFTSAKNAINDKINSVAVDDDNTVWVGTLHNMYVYNAKDDRLERVSIKGVDGNTVNAILPRGNLLYFGTTKQGLKIYDKTKKQVVATYSTTSATHRLPSDYIKDIYIDRKNNLWICTYNDGVCVIRQGQNMVETFNTENGLSSNRVRSLRESPVGEIWVGTAEGLNVINPVTGRISVYNKGMMGAHSFSSIYSIFFDRMSTVWIGTYSGGVIYYNPYGHLFNYFNPSKGTLKDIGVMNDAVEMNGMLYVCTEGSGLIGFNCETSEFSQYTLPDRPVTTFKTIYKDGDRLLCSTQKGEIYAFSPATKQFSKFWELPTGQPIYCIKRNRAGQLMVGAIGPKNGLTFVNPDGTSYNTFPLKGGKSIIFPNVICIYEAENDVYLIGTKSNGLYCYDKINQRLLYADRLKSVGQFISSIIRDRSGRIWVSSTENGLSEVSLATGKITTYNESNGLRSNQICKVVESNDNTLWLSSLNGISNFDLRTHKFVNYGQESGILVQEFTTCSGLRLSNNDVFFGGNNGFVLFTPSDIITNPSVPPVVIEKLFVNNKLVLPGDETGILEDNIMAQKKIVLDYDEANFNIEYCALSYVFNNKSEYKYKLEGFDKEWNTVGNRRTAYYTNVPAGTYRFVVMGTNNDGVWNEDGASITVVVRPPLWKTWWAYLIYIICISAITYRFIKHSAEKRRMKNSILMEQEAARVHEQYYQERNRLFTNFSHELRTPLTLIMAPLDDLVQNKELDGDMRYKMGLIQRNAKRMMRLVNNLMDLQKNESGSMKLQVAEYDFVKFTDEVILAFKDMAVYRNIHLEYRHPQEHIISFFDWNLFEKVYYNLLSNAFKNVPNDGHVILSVDVKEAGELAAFGCKEKRLQGASGTKYITVAVQDNGIGIASGELDKIFKPFYQVAQNEHSKSGTGIGLSLTQAIVFMHHGTIWAENAGSGTGAVFKFVIPIDAKLYDASQWTEKKVDSAVEYDLDIPETEYEPDTEQKKSATILVVEDNRDLNDYICSCLSEKYNVVGVANGEKALEKAINILPNLIVTDLMMAKMDGMELIAHLKENVNTSHIPIIMVTAKSNPEDIQKGYEAGADEYITKPFDPKILKVRVDNLITKREQLKKLYSKNFSLESLGVDLTPVDEKFMQSLYEMLQRNIANSDMNLESVCQEMGLSKSNLYRKIKQITGLSPNEFVRKYRLETAAKMLQETDKNITEVYYAVGFNSLAYFSNCFKAQYGMSPTEFKKQNS